MNRLALLIACLAASAAGSCLAEDAAFCKSMCASEQSQCRAQAQLPPKEEGIMKVAAPDRNVMARTAAGGVRGYDAQAIDNAGASVRRLARGGVCDAHFQQCERECGPAQDKGAAKAPAASAPRP
jgi:hypothetical protein